MTQASSQMWNSEAESLVLAALLRNPKDYYSINDVSLVPSDFQFPNHKRIAQSLFEVFDEKGDISLPMVIESLSLGGHEDEKELVGDLIVTPVNIAQAHEAARIVKSLAVGRNLQKAGVEIIDLAKERRTDYEGAIAAAESKLRRIAESVPEPERSPRTSDILRRIKQHGVRDSIPISFSPTLQYITNGFIPGHFWVVGGFSSVGKSAWACNVALDAIKARGKKVVIISAEMSQEQYLIRLLSMESGIEQSRISRMEAIGLDEQRRLADAEMMLNRDNLLVYDTIYKMSNIRSEAKRIKEHQGLDVLIIDFIQNIQGTAGDEISDAREVALECQRLGKELNCTVIGMSQLSNAMAQQDDAEKGKGDYYAFKGSGAIKDAADVAIMLRRNRRSQSPTLEMDIKKHRHGALAIIECRIDLSTGKILEEISDPGYDDDDED
jgi:replicative DNA helicase